MRFLVRYVTAAILALVCLPANGFGEDKFFDSSGVSIRYIDQGTGKPIVLVHGFGDSVEIWVARGVLQDLVKDYRVIALDMRGHGKSGKPHDPKAYGREMALDIVRILDHLDIDRAHIIGYSLGGMMTSQLLTLHPERFLTATLVAGTGLLQWTPVMERNAEQEASERERECVSRTMIYRYSPPGLPKPSEENIKAQSGACFADPNHDRFAMAAVVRSRKDQVITPAQVSAVTVPTLGIVGSLDAFQQARLRDLKRLRPDLTLVIVDGATHSGERGILRRVEFMTIVREFIAANRQTP